MYKYGDFCFKADCSLDMRHGTSKALTRLGLDYVSLADLQSGRYPSTLAGFRELAKQIEIKRVARLPRLNTSLKNPFFTSGRFPKYIDHYNKVRDSCRAQIEHQTTNEQHSMCSGDMRYTENRRAAGLYQGCFGFRVDGHLDRRNNSTLRLESLGYGDITLYEYLQGDYPTTISGFKDLFIGQLHFNSHGLLDIHDEISKKLINMGFADLRLEDVRNKKMPQTLEEYENLYQQYLEQKKKQELEAMKLQEEKLRQMSKAIVQQDERINE